MIKLSQKVGAELELPPILLRIGINAGPVVVGAIGNDLRVKFTAMGDTINLASRMETLAAPGTTYVTEETFKLTEGFFRFEAVAEEILIETEKPIKVFRVIAPSGRRTRFDVSAERGLTPLVGRERELELLADSFERAKAGNGQAVSIVSEAGMGKSRLLYEFRKSVTHEDVLFLEGKCLSYSKGVAYHPVIDILKSAFRIQEDDEDSAVRQRIVEGLEFLEIEESGIMPYLLELLSVKDSGLDRFTISLQSLKERLNEAVLQILIKGSEIRPLIVAIEDLHWADTSSIDLLHDLLSYVPGARILLIFTYRPQFVPAWSFKSYHCQISLNRLLRRESLSMVVHLLNTRTLDRKVETLILEKTEGVPFFVEEFVTSLLDLNIITKTEDTYRLAKNLAELSIPSTISDVIMARVDTLKEPAKELLQLGSIIEREFSHRLIERVAGFPEEDLQATLGVLKHSELLIERGVYPQSTYVFRHALTREDDKRAVDLESLYRYYEDNQVLFNAGLMPMYIGDILMDIDDQHLDEAEGWIQKAIDTDRQNGLTLHLGKHYALYAELQIRKGDRQRESREFIPPVSRPTLTVARNMLRLTCVETGLPNTFLTQRRRVRREGFNFFRIPERGILEKSCLTNAATISIF